MLTSTEIAAIQRVFSQLVEVDAVYLFGSAANDNRREYSDIDLGIVTAGESVTERKVDILAELAHSGIDVVDLVVVNTADTVTQYEIVRLNEVLYSKPSFDRGAFYSRVIRKYLDLKPYLDRQRKAYQRRVLHGSS